jgi:hypothetical protein
MIDTDSASSWKIPAINWYTTYSTNSAGQQGIFLAAIMVGTLALMGVGTVTGSIVMTVIGLMGVAIFGLVQGISPGYIITIAVIGVMIIFVVKKEGTV